MAALLTTLTVPLIFGFGVSVVHPNLSQSVKGPLAGPKTGSPV
jgi:hypothetical protein